MVDMSYHAINQATPTTGPSLVHQMLKMKNKTYHTVRTFLEKTP